MKLLQISYRNKGGSVKQALFLFLGETDDRFIGLTSENITPVEAEHIRANKTYLDGVSLESKVSWVKKEVPGAYRRAYRALVRENCQILDQIPL